jgi:hypothetical protein
VRRQDNSRADLPLTRWSAHPILVGLGVGLLIGPAGLHLLEPHVVEDSGLVESMSEFVLLVVLFCVGRAYGFLSSGTSGASRCAWRH